MGTSTRNRRALAIGGTNLALLGALAVILSGYGYQWNWWSLGTGFNIIPWGTGAAVLGGIAAAAGLWRMKDRSRGYTFAGVAGIVLGLLALGNLGYWYMETQKGYPPIHDLSTDTLNPPEFQAILPLREDAPNPAEYQRGEGVAAAQESFYSGLETITLDTTYDEAFNRALETARGMGWTMVDHSTEEGRIEAYHKLAWFGFVDDVVIRVDTTDFGSKVDIRSKSRIGRGDLGVNAWRIRQYIEAFETQE
ncbi:MAG: DUF1499 domain-containing protein [Balneolaceae bacterium]|nr:DUF1499 domain-containing protein [Balneolaceae bacterium]